MKCLSQQKRTLRRHDLLVRIVRSYRLRACLLIVFSQFAILGPCSGQDKVDPKRSAMRNSLGMKLLCIDSGEFSMGSPDSDTDAIAYERPLHRVEISKSFEIGCHEVTIGQYRMFAGEAKYITEVEASRSGGYGVDIDTGELWNGKRFNWKFTGFPQTEDHPVVNVTWD